MLELKYVFHSENTPEKDLQKSSLEYNFSFFVVNSRTSPTLL